jgi:hypothetical protein
MQAMRMNKEDNVNQGYQATLFFHKGQRISYAERSGQDDALIWGRWLMPLASAKAFGGHGIGRRGSFQKVHGLYLMPIRASKKTRPELYCGVRSEAP